MVAANSPSRRSTPAASAASRAGVGDVGQRVAGEHLAAEHDEVADQSRQQRDRGAGEQRVLDERVAEHVGQAVDRVRGQQRPGGRRRADRCGGGHAGAPIAGLGAVAVFRVAVRRAWRLRVAR